MYWVGQVDFGLGHQSYFKLSFTCKEFGIFETWNGCSFTFRLKDIWFIWYVPHNRSWKFQFCVYNVVFIKNVSISCFSFVIVVISLIEINDEIYEMTMYTSRCFCSVTGNNSLKILLLGWRFISFSTKSCWSWLRIVTNPPPTASSSHICCTESFPRLPAVNTLMHILAFLL